MSILLERKAFEACGRGFVLRPWPNPELLEG